MWTWARKVLGYADEKEEKQVVQAKSLGLDEPGNTLQGALWSQT
jgi:hypothetical protein